MSVLYEQENFVHDPVPIRVIHHYYDHPISTVTHWHRNLELDYTLKGTAWHFVNGKAIICGPGEICIINSGELHSNRSDVATREIEALTLQISADFLDQWIGIGKEYRLPKEPLERKEIEEILRKLYEEETASDPEKDYRRMILLFEMVRILSRNCVKRNDIHRNHQEGLDRFRSVIAYLEDHYREELGLKAVSAQFGYSPAYLSRSFKKYVGYNYYRHIQIIRLNAAIEDLERNPQKTTLDCAADNGFPNVKSFINSFKSEYGCTPSEWKRRNFQ